jgi:hypothetical protein
MSKDAHSTNLTDPGTWIVSRPLPAQSVLKSASPCKSIERETMRKHPLLPEKLPL